MIVRWFAAVCGLGVVACGPGEPEPERSATRRLTAEEYQNTVWALVGAEVPRSMLPADELIAGFPNNVASAVGGFDAETYLSAAEWAAAEAVGDVSGLTGCVELTRECVAAWSPRFLLQAYRRPPTDAEVGRVMTLYDAADTPTDGVRLMVTGTLMTGSFLYRPETRGERSGAVVWLDDFEVASRLSYLLWRSMPDAALLDAAAQGGLSTPEAVAEHATRMLADPRAHAALASFHLDWLGIANTARLERVPPSAGPVQIDLLDQAVASWETWGAFEEGRYDGAVAVFNEDAVEAHAFHGTELGPEFKIRGRWMAEDDDGEVGLVVLTTGLDDERDFRIQRVPGGRYAVTGAECTDFTEFRAPAGGWVEFEITGVARNMDTTIEVKLWDEGDPTPANRQLVCVSASTRRGTVALWSEGPGRKGWAGLQLQTEPPVPDFDFGPLAEAYVAETRGFVSEWAARGGVYQELLTADWTMANEVVADLYGIRGVTGSDLQAVTLPPERRGILTQPLFLASWAKPNQSSPVHRGVAIRQSLLCDVLPPPPPDVAIIAPDPSPELTTRERFAQHTDDPACASCHLLTDPIGFGFEAFDHFGAWRETENGQPVDTSGEIIGVGSVVGPFDGARELVERLADADEVRSCITRQWLRYTRARIEDDSAVDPALRAALRACDDDACSVDEIVTALVQSEGFTSRAAHDGDAP